MDGREFDALARSLAGGGTRRGVLRAGLALAGAALGLGGVTATDASTGRRQVGSPCVTNSHCVTGVCGPAGARRKECQCVSAADCPASTNPCAVAACIDGVCGVTPAAAGTACGVAEAGSGCGLRVCPGDSTLCAPAVSCSGETPDCCGECTNVQTDPVNCGGCNVACASGETCTNGVCLCGGSVCPAGSECINGGCFFVPENCACPSACNSCVGSVDGSPNFLCMGEDIGPGCTTTADCPAGRACKVDVKQCITAC